MPGHTRRTFLKVSGGVLGGIATGATVTAAESADRFIVLTRGETPPSDLDVVHPMPGVDAAVVRGTESAVNASSRVTGYAADIEIALDLPDVNANTPTAAEATPTDEPLYPYQWDKQSLDVETAHETSTGEGTRVAIIDSGVAAGHPDLNVNEALSQNFTGDGLGAANAAGGYHGSHVGGIVAAQDNALGVIGTAPDTDLVDCRVFSTTGGAAFGDILAAITYSAAIGADAANLSLGAYPVPRQALGSFYGEVLNRVMTYANSAGTLLVMSAGNAAADLQHDKNFISLPNEGAQALGVSATGPVGFAEDLGFSWNPAWGDAPAETPAIYTNYGTNTIDIGAPGGNYSIDALEAAGPWYYDLVLNTVAEPTYTTDSEGNVTGIADTEYTYGWVAGTSMAAPQVAGAAALVKSTNPGFNANQVESALKNAASVPDEYAKTYYGSGYLNIVDAL